MPKIVDNYVLERKIGSGQFGEVYKGYNKITNVDIAVKVTIHFFLILYYFTFIKNIKKQL